jgi:hypothetical protein
MDEDLDKWFKEKWVNIGKKVDGNHPPCGTSGEMKGYAKCVPAAKAAGMSKKEKESATKRKRAAQNKAGRGGKDSKGQGKKPIYVSTKPKNENMNIEERLNLFLEKNCPTDPGKWSASKSAAKSKFDVYPSAYANGWAAKNYKSKGGGWRKCNEGESNGLCEYGEDNFSAPQPDFDRYDAVSNPKADPSKTLTGRFTDPSVGLNEACWEGYKQVGMKDKGSKMVPNCVPIDETIKKVDGKYVVYPKKGGERLGTHDSYTAALKQLNAIEISKHMHEDIGELNDGEYCSACLKEYILEHANVLTEAEYQGRKVSLGKPMRGDVKKFKVFVKDPSTGNVKKVNFGDPNMRIKKSNPARRKSFRARHKCATAKDRTSARYWSCRKW